jgi:hypothetical protein
MRRLVAVLLSCVLCGSIHAASIEVRLIRASNEAEKSDEELTKLEPKLKKVFGYQQYKQLGIQKAELKDRETLRLNLGEGIVVFVTPTTSENKAHVIDFEMYSGRAALIKSTVHVPHGRPMFIKGPDVGDTLLVVSLVVVNEPVSP